MIQSYKVTEFLGGCAKHDTRALACSILTPRNLAPTSLQAVGWLLVHRASRNLHEQHRGCWLVFSHPSNWSARGRRGRRGVQFPAQFPAPTFLIGGTAWSEVLASSTATVSSSATVNGLKGSAGSRWSQFVLSHAAPCVSTKCTLYAWRDFDEVFSWLRGTWQAP
eukprot:1954305-Pyramimonas_sp.AAC.2